MIKETTITIFGDELESVLGVRPKYDHQAVRDVSYTKPTILAATVSGYRGTEEARNAIFQVTEIKEEIVALLKGKGHIPSDSKCKVGITALHLWGSYDEYGYAYAPSVYSHYATITL